VYHVAWFASDIAIIKPVIRKYAPELLIKDKYGRNTRGSRPI